MAEGNDGHHFGGTVKSSTVVRGCAACAHRGPRKAVAMACMLTNKAHGTLCSSAIAGSEWWQKSMMIQSGFLPPATASARNAANGAARPSTAFLMSSLFSGGTSAVDSAPSGRPSTTGGGSPTRRTRGDKCAGTGGSLATFLGVERSVTAWPLAARRLASSRNGIMCPNASHGNSTTSSVSPSAASIVTILAIQQQGYKKSFGCCLIEHQWSVTL
ncbi:UDP-glycosyltransferase 91D1 [Dichanthelium oligosanthes]|uniref:UDP-glycosyltransferase 91D1 n=1 Tax=Dichanthelium oligosanthes TaxID=888268 RepID=A0A1E5VCP5_9POAL|nr:UDP-glycosyltransferase 91D1 [Dichanthelium oligosanthes]